MLSHFSCVRLFATLWTRAIQASRSMRFSRQKYWSGLPCLPPGDLPNPGIEPMALKSPALANGFFTTRTTREAWLSPNQPVKRESLPRLSFHLTYQGVLWWEILKSYWSFSPQFSGESCFCSLWFRPQELSRSPGTNSMSTLIPIDHEHNLNKEKS